MTKTKLKLPSLKTTSRGIAEDLKAIKEAINAKPTGAQGKNAVPKRKYTKRVKFENNDDESSPTKVAEKQSEHYLTSAASGNRPQRQRKPNQRYTDLISEIQTTFRNRTTSSRSEPSSVEGNEFAEVDEPVEKKKYSGKKATVAKKSPQTSKKKILQKVTKQPSPEPPESDEDEKDSDLSSLTDEDESETDSELDETPLPPPPPAAARPVKQRKQQQSQEAQEQSQQSVSAKEPTLAEQAAPKRRGRPPLKPGAPRATSIRGGRRTTAGKAVRDQAAAAAVATGVNIGFQAPPEFVEDDDTRHAVHFMQQASSMGGVGSSSSYHHQHHHNQIQSPTRAIDDFGVGVYYESSREAAVAALALSDYGTGVSVIESSPQTASMIGGYGSSSSIVNQQQPSSMVGGGSLSAYEPLEPEDDVPALVYGPGPRVITYNGEFYPLSPIPSKRRMSKYPRPRSSRYKPFSVTYKPPDVMRYRRKPMRRPGDIRRRIRATLPPLGGDWSAWAARFGAGGDETRDALMAMRGSSGIGSGDDEYGDDDAYEFDPDDWAARRLGLSAAGRPMRSRYDDEEAAARGVYGELDFSSSMENYNVGMAHHRPPADVDEVCVLPPDIAGDHCYIKPPYDPNAVVMAGRDDDMTAAGGLASEDDEDDLGGGDSGDGAAADDVGRYGVGHTDALTAAGIDAHAGVYGAEMGHRRRGPAPVTLKIGVNFPSTGRSSFADYSFAAVSSARK